MGIEESITTLNHFLRRALFGLFCLLFPADASHLCQLQLQLQLQHVLSLALLQPRWISHASGCVAMITARQGSSHLPHPPAPSNHNLSSRLHPLAPRPNSLVEPGDFNTGPDSVTSHARVVLPTTGLALTSHRSPPSIVCPEAPPRHTLSVPSNRTLHLCSRHSVPAP